MTMKPEDTRTVHQYSDSEQVQFMPGPWRITVNSGGSISVHASINAPFTPRVTRAVCQVGYTLQHASDELRAAAHANARLIAAAPDMYEALQFVLTDPCAQTLGSVTLDEVRTALSKARDGSSSTEERKTGTGIKVPNSEQAGGSNARD